MISDITGFSRGSLPFSYLGCTIFKGLSKQIYFEKIVMKIQNKVDGWKAKILSPGGKLILVKHVLSNMPIHVLLVFDVPQLVIKRIQNIMANFLWGGSGDVKKRHWLS